MATATTRPLSGGRYPVSNPGAQKASPSSVGVWPGRHHGPPLSSTDRPQAASSNIPANIALETESTGFVKGLVSLQAEAAADDLLHDLGGAAEGRLDAAVGSDVIRPLSHRRPPRVAGRPTPVRQD